MADKNTLSYPLPLFRLWAKELFNGTVERLFLQIPRGYRGKHIKNALSKWKAGLNEEDKSALERILSIWLSQDRLDPIKPRMTPNEDSGRITRQGLDHIEGRPVEDEEVAKLMREGEVLLTRDADTAMQKQIMEFVKGMPLWRAAAEVAGNMVWKRAACLKRGNILPSNLANKVRLVVEKRKSGVALAELAGKLGAPYVDLRRWAFEGSIRNLGISMMYGERILMDLDDLPDAQRIARLKQRDINLPESKRVYGYWTQKTILGRGWSKVEVTKHLGEPDLLVPNPHWKAGPEMRLFLKSRVLEVEEARTAPVKKLRSKEL